MNSMMTGKAKVKTTASRSRKNCLISMPVRVRPTSTGRCARRARSRSTLDARGRSVTSCCRSVAGRCLRGVRPQHPQAGHLAVEPRGQLGDHRGRRRRPDLARGAAVASSSTVAPRVGPAAERRAGRRPRRSGRRRSRPPGRPAPRPRPGSGWSAGSWCRRRAGSDQLPELPARLRVEAGRRLVEEQQLRAGRRCRARRRAGGAGRRTACAAAGPPFSVRPTRSITSSGSRGAG